MRFLAEKIAARYVAATPTVPEDLMARCEAAIEFADGDDTLVFDSGDLSRKKYEALLDALSVLLSRDSDSL